MTTIREVARAAGVSLGTVSNYLNDPAVVADETRERIRSAIDDLGYHPRAAARSLRTSRTTQVGLVPIVSPSASRSGEPGDAAFLEFLAGLNTVAAEHGYAVLLAAAAQPDQELAILRRLVGERRVDAMAVLGIRADDERVDFLLRAGFPFVTFGRTRVASTSGMRRHAFVDIDGEEGLRRSVAHLADLGHRRIAYVTPPAELYCTEQRWAGFRAEMDARGIPIRDEYVIGGDFHEDSGRTAGSQLMDLAEPPTAVIAANDLCGLGLMTAFRERGYRIGDEVSIIGFDDIEPAAHWDPPLTTVHQPFRRIGMSVMESFLSILGRPQGERAYPQVVVKARLVERGSTGPAPGES